MYFGQRKIGGIKKVLWITVAYCLVVLFLAVFFPAHGASSSTAFLRWFFGIPSTLALWLALEWLGTTVVDLPFWLRMPSWVRVTLLAFLVFAVVVACIALHTWWLARGAA